VNDIIPIKEPIPALADGRELRIQARRKAAYGTASQKAWQVLLAAITMIILEGAFRKWVPAFGNGTGRYLMYFSKDIIFAALLFFPNRSLPTAALKTFENWLLPGCVLLGAGALLSSLHGFNPVGAVLTARAMVVLPVIAWLAVPRLAGLPLKRVIWLLIGFTVLNFALGVEQNRLPPDNILNRYAAETDQIVVVDSGVRATGTFSFIAGMGIISSIGIWAGLALMSLAKTQWQRIGAWAALASGFGCGLASVSRGPIVVGVAMVAGWLVSSREGVSAVARGLASAIFCAVVATGFGIMPIFSDLGSGLMQRHISSDEVFQQRAFGQLGETAFALQTAPFGNGLGTEQVAGVYYATGEANFNKFESPLPRLIMETGALGFIGYLLVCAGALLALQRAKRDADAGARGMLLATQMLLVPMFYGSVFFDHTASAFVWMIFAAVMASAETNQKTDMLKTDSGNRRSEFRNQRSQRAPFAVTQVEKPES
jgi:hypothetical protein